MMRKILLIATLFVIGFVSVATLDAAKKKGGGKARKITRAKSSRRLVATAGDYKLYSDGTIKAPCMAGTYSKTSKGYYVWDASGISSPRCGDGWDQGVIVDGVMYQLGGGTDGCIEYVYDHESRIVRYTDNCDSTAWTERLSECEMAYPVKWVKR